jgi:hypothetical protein
MKRVENNKRLERNRSGCNERDSAKISLKIKLLKVKRTYVASNDFFKRAGTLCAPVF